MNPPELIFISLIEQNERVEVSVPGMEDIGNHQIILLSHLDNLAQNLRKSGSRHRAVANQVIGSKPGNGAKGALSARPQLSPLCLVFCSLDFTDPVLTTNLHNLLGKPFHSILEPV